MESHSNDKKGNLCTESSDQQGWYKYGEIERWHWWEMSIEEELLSKDIAKYEWVRFWR